jgi:hypothetical protein
MNFGGEKYSSSTDPLLTSEFPSRKEQFSVSQETPPIITDLDRQIATVSEIIHSLGSHQKRNLSATERTNLQKTFAQVGLSEIKFAPGSVAETIAQLKLLHRELITEKQTTQQDLKFLAKEGRLSSDEHQQVTEIAHSSQASEQYRRILTSFANTEHAEDGSAKNEKNAEAVSAFALQILSFAEYIQNPQSRNRKELKEQMGRCFIEIGRDRVTIQSLLGEATFKSLMSELDRPGLSPHTEATFLAWKERFYTSLLSARVVTGIWYLSLRENQHSSRKNSFSAELSSFLDNNFFSDLDEFIHISGFLKKSEETFPTAAKQQHALASFLHDEVATGKVSGTFARELYFDARRQSSDVLLMNYLTSFAESVPGIVSPKKSSREHFSEGKKSRERNQRLLRLATMLLLFSSLSIAAYTQKDNVEKIPHLVQSIAETVKTLPSEISSMIESKLGIRLPDLSPPENVPATANPESNKEENHFTVSESVQLLDQLTQAEEIKLANNTEPGKLTHPTVDGIGNEHHPGGPGLEGIVKGGRDIIWEMKNWSSYPDFLSTATYTAINKETGGFSRWQPEATTPGADISGLDYTKRDELPEFVVGTRSLVSQNWFEVPHIEGKRIDQGSIWVIQDGQKVGEYYLEWVQSPNSYDQFLRAKVRDEDIAWVKDREGKVELKLAFNYRDYTPEDPKPNFTPYKDNVIALSELPTDLQSTIQKLNGDTSLSDEEKMIELQKWFTGFGMYSENSRDNQLFYINTAINNNLLLPNQNAKAFLKAFFYGAEYSGLGLPAGSEFPRKGAGECNRRNIAAKEVFELLDLKGKWYFVLDAGSLGPGAEVKGSSAHARFTAINVETSKRVVLDTTAAPETDHVTDQAIQAGNNINRNPVKPEEEKPFVYSPGPEVSRNAAYIPPIEIPYQNLKTGAIGRNDTNFSYTRDIDLTKIQLPWQYSQLSQKLVDESDMIYNNQLQLSLAQAKINDRGFLVLDDSLINISPAAVTDIYSIDSADARSNSYNNYHYLVTLHNTNTVPLLEKFNSLIEYSSIRVNLPGYPGKIPFRLMRYAGLADSKVLVIDLPPSLLNGKSVEISYNADKPITDIYADPRMLFTGSPVSFEQAKQNLAAFELSDNDLLRMYIQNMIRQVEQQRIFMRNEKAHAEDRTRFGDSTGTEKALTAARSYDKSIRLNLFQAVQDLRNHPETSSEVAELMDFYSRAYIAIQSEDATTLGSIYQEIDQKYPNFLSDFFLSKSSSTTGIWTSFNREMMTENYGVVSDTGEAIMNDLVAVVKTGKPILLHKIIDIDSPRDERLLDILIDYIQNYQLPEKLPYDSLQRKINTANTSELAGMEACQALSENEGSFYHCLMNLPATHDLTNDALFNKIYYGLNDPTETQQSTYKIIYSLEKKDGAGRDDPLTFTNGVSATFLTSEVTTSQLDVFITFAWEYPIGTSNPVYYLSNEHYGPTIRELPYEERLPLLQAEQQAMQEWYQGQILEGLMHGNGKIWARLLALLAVPALVAYLGLRGVAHRRRWSTYRSIGEFAVKGREALQKKSKLTELLSAELDMDVPLLTASELDEAWSTPERGVSAKDVFIRRLVTRTGLEGKMKKFPGLGIPERLKKPENPWSSREVPPTYAEHVTFTKPEISGYVSMLEIEDEEKRDEFQEELEKVLALGTPQAHEKKRISGFKENQLVLEDRNAWCTNIMEHMMPLYETIRSEVSEDAFVEVMTAITADLAETWTLIMTDYQEMHTQRKAGSVFAKIRNVLHA